MQTNKGIIDSASPYFEANLELAATRRMAIQMEFTANPGAWEKVFVDTVAFKDNQLLITTLKGKTYQQAEITAIDVPFAEEEVTQMSCACKL